MNKSKLPIFYLFILGSIIGWIYEFVIDNKPNYNLGIKLPVLFIYGLGIVILYYVYPFISNYPWYIRLIIYSIVFTLFEFIMSKISFKYYGFHTWKYKNNQQIDIIPSIVWGILGLLTELIFISKTLKK